MDCVKKCDIFGNLFIALGTVVGLTEHLAIGDVGSTSFGPSGNMIGIHFGELPNTSTISIMTEGTKGAITDVLFFGKSRLS